jgi:large subunit ribosomal protein L17
MRHRKAKSLNNRFTSWKNATLASMARAVILQQSIRTTKIKAASAQPLIEKLVTLAKSDTLFAKRQAFAILGDHRLVAHLFKEIGPRFASRAGGYTRMLNLGQRRGDGSDLVILELTEIKKQVFKKHKKAKDEKSQDQEHGHPASDAAPSEEPHEEEKKPAAAPSTPKESRSPIQKKPTKKFFGGLRGIFKKERDSL